jgi:hypothetical protein
MPNTISHPRPSWISVTRPQRGGDGRARSLQTVRRRGKEGEAGAYVARFATNSIVHRSSPSLVIVAIVSMCRVARQRTLSSCAPKM